MLALIVLKTTLHPHIHGLFFFPNRKQKEGLFFRLKLCNPSFSFTQSNISYQISLLSCEFCSSLYYIHIRRGTVKSVTSI
jgi:hypothetical protein